MSKFEVAIVYRGQSNYIVEAETCEEAENLARRRYYNDEEPDLLGNEWEQIEQVSVSEE